MTNSVKLRYLPRRSWDVCDFFSTARIERINDSNSVKNKLWKDLYTEYDARHLYRAIHNRCLIRTSEFKRYLKDWVNDEARHTEGFIFLMVSILGENKQNLEDKLEQRKHDFSQIDSILCNEFRLLTAIGFDELVTCRAYAEDRGFYHQFDVQELNGWLRHLIADEAVHFQNAVYILKRCHSHRLNEVKSVLDDLLGVRNIKSEYQYTGTFIMDYFGDEYTSELLEKCYNTFLRVVGCYEVNSQFGNSEPRKSNRVL